jgi:threonine/homoserine/homoserine lactone efflux protein
MVSLGLGGGVMGLVSLVCWVMILVRLFEREGAGRGILGIVCGIYTFFWGWQHASGLDLEAERKGESPRYRTIMTAWTAAIAASLLFNTLLRFAR